MAEDWIKMRLNLHEDAAVIAMATDLGADEFAIVGRLHRLWSWADQQTEDGVIRNLSAAFVDRFIQFPGFFAAMARVGWIEETETGFRFPNFETHNGESAKRRAKDNRRKSAGRKGKQASAKVPENVRDLSAKVPKNFGQNEDQRREEEIREEYTPSSSPYPSSPSEVPFASRQEGEEGKADFVPQGWHALELRLKEIGMVEAGEAVDRCRGQGLAPEDVGRVIEFWAAKPVGYWPSMVGALHTKLTRIIEGEAVDEAWPQPADKFLKREANEKASQERQQAHQREIVAKSESNPVQRPRIDPERLESEFGSLLNSMTAEERDLFFEESAANGFEANLFRKKWKVSGGTRRKLLGILAESTAFNTS